MDDKTIKEICDVVTEEVMKQVRKNLSAMKPDIIEQIKNSVKKTAIQETQRITDSKYNKIDNRISQLEATIAKLTAEPAKPQQPKAERIPTKAVDGINTLSPSQIDEILSFPAYYREANGWIYYIKVNPDGYGGYLFKVKPDGTQNQKIFNEQISGGEYDADVFFRVTENEISFKDYKGRSRIIMV